MTETKSKQYLNGKAMNNIHINYKLFKKADKTELNLKTDQQISSLEIKSDDNTSKVYQEILEMPSKTRTKKISKRKFYKVKEKIIRNLDRQTFFRAASNNDPDTIEKVFLVDRDCIYWSDSFGWTALMIAACEGAVLSFRKLLDRGANLLASDKTGSTSESLAKLKNHQGILHEIKIFTQCQNNIIELSDDDIEFKMISSIHCFICKMNFKEATLEEHTSSTLHLFNKESSINSNRKWFGIPSSCRGYKIMVKYGWDQQSPLGTLMQGKLYPIKTVLRKNKIGLGVKQTSAKITHFGPYDDRSVNYVAPTNFPSKKEINKDFSAEKRLERFLRHELS